MFEMSSRVQTENCASFVRPCDSLFYTFEQVKGGNIINNVNRHSQLRNWDFVTFSSPKIHLHAKPRKKNAILSKSEKNLHKRRVLLFIAAPKFIIQPTFNLKTANTKGLRFFWHRFWNIFFPYSLQPNSRRKTTFLCALDAYCHRMKIKSEFKFVSI